MRFSILASLVLWTISSVAAPGQVVLKDMKITPMSGNKVKVTFEMSKPVNKPIAFTVDNPARIAFDFKNTVSYVKRGKYPVNVGNTKSLFVVSARGRTRIVANLSKMIPYTSSVDGNKVHIVLDAGNVAARRPAKVRRAMIKHADKRIATIKGIAAIDFRRGHDGQGRVIVKLSDPSIGVDIRKQGNKLVADFLNTSLPKNMERRLDVMDFATPVKTVDTFRQGRHVRMIISPKGDFKHMAYQSNNVYTIEVKSDNAHVVSAKQGIRRSGFRGNRLTLNFQNIKVRSVLQLLADFTGKNIVVSDSVKGSLTLRLKNVPWDQALDIILKTKGLAMREAGNVLRVAPAAEIAQIEQAELSNIKKTEDLSPLRTEWFQINYASAKDILATLSNKNISLLSKRGKAVIDGRTNTLMVQDTSRKLKDIRRLIRRLDIPVRQVLIQSRIVIASNDFTKDIGVKFGVSTTGLVRNDPRQFQNIGGPNQDPSGSNLGTTPMVDMGVDPAKSKAGRLGIAIGRLGAHVLQLELSALQAEGKGEIVSSPRLITANQKEAFIEQGIEIPYAEASSSGAASVSFKKAVLSLKVKPQITPDDRIILELEVKKDSADLKTTIGTAQNVAINTREIKTQVLVNNGETIVLGGVYESEKDKKVNRVPILGKLPLIGALFRDKVIVDKKSELLIFVTPKIIKEQVNKSVKH